MNLDIFDTIDEEMEAFLYGCFNTINNRKDLEENTVWTDGYMLFVTKDNNKYVIWDGETLSWPEIPTVTFDTEEEAVQTAINLDTN